LQISKKEQNHEINFVLLFSLLVSVVHSTACINITCQTGATILQL